jgi:hypothetical protein
MSPTMVFCKTQRRCVFCALFLQRNKLHKPFTPGNPFSLPSTLNPTAFYAHKSPRGSFRSTSRPTYKPRPYKPPFGYRTPYVNPLPYAGPAPNGLSLYFRSPSTIPGILPTPGPTTRSSSTSPSLFSNPPEVCQICSKKGHTARARDCWHRYDAQYRVPSQPQAHATHTTLAPPSGDWFLDFGATHHVTSDLNNVSSFIPYEGLENLHIGNGTGMKILHIGSSTISLSNHSIIFMTFYMFHNS